MKARTARASPGVPLAHWGYHAVGVEVNWTTYLYTTLESGVAYYRNRKDSRGGPTCIYLVPIGYRWGKSG